MSRAKFAFYTALFAVLLLVPGIATSALFHDQMNNGATWGINGSAGGDFAATFNYDYSANGIPEAPHSLGTDDATRGVKLEANIVDPGDVQFFTLYPLGQSFSNKYRLRFDAWMNFQAGGDFSTEFLGGGVGYDNVTADVASGAQAIATSDGGSGSDWRAFKSPPQFFIAAAAMAGGTRQGSDAYYADFLPAVPAPASQSQPLPGVAGSPGFQWITWEFDVNGSNVNVTIEKPDGSRLPIVSIDCSNTADGSAGCSTSGNISLYYADLFSSLSPRPDIQFGVIDNVIVVPEPAASALCLLGSLGLLGTRRRR